jgi:RNA polymerase sigma-70 factor (ECF subfamily)
VSSRETQDAEESAALRPLSREVEDVLLRGRSRFLAFLERRLGDRALAEETLQSALLRAIERGSPAVDADGAVTWFYRVLRNALIDAHRHAAVESRALAQEARDSEQRLSDPELHDAVCACLQGLIPTLKGEYADIVRRVDLESEPLAEVARTEGITANNATVRLHRARRALKKQLERTCRSCATHGCIECACKKGSAVLTHEEKTR